MEQMELQFVDGMELEIGENCEFELPNYVTRLADEEIREARNSPDKESLVIAAGTDPKDEKVTLLTATGKVMIFDARKYHVPPGPAVPSPDGRKIFLENKGGRWPGPSIGFYVEARWMLEKSVSALIGATLVTNYKDENKT
jgi:hypothetical protein